jgi:hypothetical protein
MRKPLAAATAAATAILIAGCSSSSSAGTHYTSAQAIADKLTAAGFTVSMLHKSTGNAITEAGGQSYDFTVTAKPGVAPGDSGINMFPNHEALVSWTALSKSFGGVAITGDTWAVSLATDGTARASSVAMAPRIATTLGGTVQK